MRKSSIRISFLICIMATALAFPQSKSASTEGLAGLDKNQKERILNLLDSMRIHVTSLEGKKWPRRKQCYLAIGSDSLKSKDNFQFQVFAFDLSAPKMRLMAMSDEPVTLGRGEVVGGFDFAAYQMNPHECAFGIRYSLYRTYSGGGASLEEILLFRIQGAGIGEVLNTTTAFEADLAGEWNEDGTRNRSSNSGHAVIIVGKHRTNGYFDWVKKTDEGKSVPLIWDGKGYAMQGEDPFPTDELDIFESR